VDVSQKNRKISRIYTRENKILPPPKKKNSNFMVPKKKKKQLLVPKNPWMQLWKVLEEQEEIRPLIM
jgi:hypothetical protein